MKKKLFYLMIASLLLAGCSDVIDKKVSFETAKEDIQKIKEEHKDEYTDEDFEAISYVLAGSVFRAVLTKGEDAAKGIKFDKTYKDFLEEAKKER